MTSPLPPETAERFCVPGPGPYVLTHSVGCLPKASMDALHAGFLRPWSQQGGDAWQEWLARHDAFRSALADLLGGMPEEYCAQANLSSGLSKLLSSLPRNGSSKRVLLAAEDSFPSLGFVLKQAERFGFEARLIPRERSPALLETWSQALTDEVRAVLVTHVHSQTGVVAPVEAIARLCAEREILCIVDVAQSAGILPLAVHTLGAHVVLGSCVKWLCGGPGAGFMWIAPGLIEQLEPADVGWFSHADPFRFDIHSFEYAHDARRFWGGTPSVAPFVLAAASLQVLNEIGVRTILAHNRALMDVFAMEMPRAWRARIPAPEQTGGTLCIRADSELDAVRARLQEADVRFDCRGEIVRLSFHIVNTHEHALRIARAWPR